MLLKKREVKVLQNTKFSQNRGTRVKCSEICAPQNRE